MHGVALSRELSETMDLQVITDNLLAGPILFFLFGFVAVALKADLELPQPLPKFLSTFLVIAIGLKGGIELRHGGLTIDSFKALGLAMALSAIVPLYCFLLLKSRTTAYNAAAIGATYGSVSAVTFITAISTLDGLHIQFHGYMVAAMALMEAPAIIVGVVLVQYFAQGGPPRRSPSSRSSTMPCCTDRFCCCSARW